MRDEATLPFIGSHEGGGAKRQIGVPFYTLFPVFDHDRLNVAIVNYLHSPFIGSRRSCGHHDQGVLQALQLSWDYYEVIPVVHT